MSQNLILFGAVYKDVYAALADLETFERLDKRKVGGPYDAAVVDLHEGLPHVVKRAKRPTLELIPELVARGRPPIGVLANPLAPSETALAVVGSPELEKAFTRAVRRAVMTTVRTVASEELGPITKTA
ncbi:MAG TPA: hypothetical protein VF066_08705 [Thermoleophilaceae bacterium]